MLITADLDGDGIKKVIDEGKAMQRLGFEHLIYNLKGPYTPEALKAFTHEIIPELKG